MTRHRRLQRKLRSPARQAHVRRHRRARQERRLARIFAGDINQTGWALKEPLLHPPSGMILDYMIGMMAHRPASAFRMVATP